jgi:hypothetical protein
LSRGPRAALALAVAQRWGKGSPFLLHTFLLGKQKKSMVVHGQENQLKESVALFITNQKA